MLRSVAEAATQICLRIKEREALLVGISGIDGCGKGLIARQIDRLLKGREKNVALIHIDGWLNLPSIRFSAHHPAKHFYDHAIRFEEVFSELVLPLKKRKTIDLIADYTGETAIQYRKEHYYFRDVDFILMEGIYLFKKAFRDYFDIAVWIDCTFETALERAIQRSQEGLSVDDTIHAYEQIYFPAQQIHFQQDHPQDSADIRIVNDHRM